VSIWVKKKDLPPSFFLLSSPPSLPPNQTYPRLRRLHLKKHPHRQHHHRGERLEHLNERDRQKHVHGITQRQRGGLADPYRDHVLQVHLSCHFCLVRQLIPEDTHGQVRDERGGDEAEGREEHGVVEPTAVVQVLEDVLVEEDEGGA